MRSKVRRRLSWRTNALHSREADVPRGVPGECCTDLLGWCVHEGLWLATVEAQQHTVPILLAVHEENLLQNALSAHPTSFEGDFSCVRQARRGRRVAEPQRWPAKGPHGRNNPEDQCSTPPSPRNFRFVAVECVLHDRLLLTLTTCHGKHSHMHRLVSWRLSSPSIQVWTSRCLRINCAVTSGD